MTISNEIEIVDEYLRLFGERRIEEAAAYLAQGALLIFPGRAQFADLPAMLEDAAKRYRSVQKHRDEFFVGTRASDGATMCVSSGRLYGTTLWGTAFADVRYIDLFIIRDGLIHEQHVWNDLAETGAAPIMVQRAAFPAEA
jgi:hypothetical protein